MTKLQKKMEQVEKKWFNLSDISEVEAIGQNNDRFFLKLKGKKLYYDAHLNVDTMEAYICISDLHDIIIDITISDNNRIQVANFWAKLEELSFSK